MVCHGELVRLKPKPKYLTGFYLIIALGGAIGGFFTAVLAPFVFKDFYEFHSALGATLVFACICWLADRSWFVARPFLRLAFLLPIFIASACGCVLLVRLAQQKDEQTIYQSRNFYGVLKVTEVDYGDYILRSLEHGRILHGKQFFRDPRRYKPISYYGPKSGVGLALTYHPKRLNANSSKRALKVGVVGLGTGTIAAYGKPGDVFRFYEINPEVEKVARKYFRYLEDSKAVVQVVLGDARVSLERELAEGNRQNFDVLAVDAFTSDAIPVHLLTVECARVYKAHLAPDGILLLHISNRFLNLNPVTRAMAEALGFKAVLVDSDEDEEQEIDLASWVILTRNEEFLNDEHVLEAATPWPDDDPPPLLWTDSFASLWKVVDWD